MLFEYPSEGNVSFHDYDIESLRLFLDCLFKFKDYTPEIALIIFPIAHKYQVRECLEKCIEVLSPTKLNENICLALNLAVFYDCNILYDRIIHFLTKNNDNDDGVHDVLLNEEYINLLEPAAMLKLLEFVKIDENVVNVLCDWGENYLLKNGRVMSLKVFFSEYQILDKISLKCFSTADSIFKFNEAERTKDFFTDKEVLDYFRTRFLPAIDDEWVYVKKGEILTENFVFNPPIPMVKGFVHDLDIFRNDLVVDQLDSFVKNFISYSVTLGHKLPDKCCKNLHYGSTENNNLKCFQEFLSEDRSKKYIRIPIDPYNNINLDKFGISEVKIVYTFNVKCRILKSLNNLTPKISNENNKFFTCDVQSYFDI